MPGPIKILVIKCILLIFLGTANAFTQVPVTRSQNKVIIEGVVYYIHIVKPGQTLYSISKAYGVTEKDIAIENPGVYSGLQMGQVLKIPADIPQDRQQIQAIDTTSFVYHELKQGETIFSLSKKYNVTVDEIIQANPGIDITDLSIGQKLTIPKSKSIVREEDFNLHKVRRRETLYSIARTYGVTEKDIRTYNPELQWGGLKTGQVIRIPRQEFLARQIMELPQINDTLVPVEIDSIYRKEEYAYIDSLGLTPKELDDYIRDLKEFSRDRLNVAFLIPFNYTGETDTIITEAPDPANKAEDENEAKTNLPQSIRFLEFFEGALLALDSLRNEGVVVNARFFDTYRSPSRVREILDSPFFRDVDLIIGPFFSYNVEIVSDFSRKKRIPLVSPFYEGLELTNRNPYLFQLSPSVKTEYSRAAEILSKQYDKNFIFIYKKDSLRYPEIDYYKTNLLLGLKKYNYSENVVIKEITYENPSRANLSGDLSHSFSSDRKNIVILPEADEAFVTTIITQLYFQLQNYDIEVFGLSNFYEFPNFDFQYYHALGLRYLSPYYFSYSDPQVQDFMSLFRTNFKSEPRYSTRKGCSYSMMGYDVTYYFIHQLSKWNRNFINHLNSGEVNNILPDYYFHRNNPFGGFENQSFMYIEFQKDFTITSSSIGQDTNKFKDQKVFLDH